MKALADIQKELRDTLPEGIDLVIQAIKNVLPNGTDKYNDLILIEARYREVNQQLLQGILSNEAAQLEFNKIRKDILEFINSLTESQLAKAEGTAQAGQPDIYNGEVFYRIPDKMVLEEEVKCIIRVAFDRQVLLEGIEVKQDDVVKDIRISDVMGVELIDPDPEKAFAIRTFSEAVQFVDKDLSTEWLFYVKPLKAGSHPLILKISVIEIKAGVERKRTVVLEEQVEIFTTPVPSQGEAEGFVSAGYAVNMATTQQVKSAEEERGGSAPPPPPGPPQTGPVGPSPSAPANRGGNIRKLAGVLSALLVLVVASFALYRYLAPNTDVTPSELASNDAAELRNLIKKRPGSKAAIAAQEKIDSLDTALWEQALASADTNQWKAYIKEFPDGKFITQALIMLEQARKPAVKAVIFSWQLTDSLLNINLSGGVPPYFFTFIKDGLTYQQVSKDSAGTLSVPRSGLEPGFYDVVLQDNEGRGVSDSIFVEKTDKAPEDSNLQKPTSGVTSQRKKPAAPKPKPKPGPIPKPEKPNPAPTPPTDNKPADTPPENKPAQPEQPIAVRNASRKPIYEGCEKKNRSKEERCTEQRIRDFIGDRLKYPDEALRKGIEGTVNVQFVVEKDGTITDVRYLNEIGGGCGAEAVRLVKMMPKFKPGLSSSGASIRVLYQIPITFKVR